MMGVSRARSFLMMMNTLLLIILFAHRGSAQSTGFDAVHTEISQLKDDGSSSLLLINVTAIHLSRFLGYFLSKSQWTLSTLENQVAINLFLLYSIVPHLSEVSFFGEDGLLFFAYQREGNKTLALFSNITFSSPPANLSQIPKEYCWYQQEVNHTTGIRYGEAVERKPTEYWKLPWFLNALESGDGGCSWVIRWSDQQNPLVSCIIPIKGLIPHRGVLSLGVPLILLPLNKKLDHADIYLGTEDGDSQLKPNDWPFMHKANSTNDSAFLHLQVRNASMGNETLLGLYLNVQRARYTLHRADLELLGLQIVTMVGSAHNNATHDGLQQFCYGFSVVISIFFVLMTCLYLYIINRVMRMIVLLRASLITQTEATRQAERKSMNKTVAFASTSHDVRTILATILGLIDHCIVDISHESDIHSKLLEIKSSSLKLLDILNYVLDTSKIEVGKMQLEEAEIDLEQVLDEAVDMFHLLAFKKGIEIILDPCDGSIHRYSHVKGDHKRFQQVLCNLLSNAIKFTSKGHVLVRAWARKANSKGSTLSLKYQKQDFSFWKCHCWDNNCDFDFQYLHEDSNDQNLIEVIVEVDDTGRGIPKEKYKSVFENFVQVKELDSDNCGGVGLGLGIVQSLVRLMGGEINIVDKGSSEKGTCFRFNIFLKASDNLLQIKSEKDDDILLNIVERDQSHQERSIFFDGSHSLSSQIRSKVHELASCEHYDMEGIHVFMLIKGETRKGIVKKWMEQHKFQVHSFDHLGNFCSTLKKIKCQTCQVDSSSCEVASNVDDCTRFSESCSKDQREDAVVTRSNTIDNYLSIFAASKGNRQRGSFRSRSAILLIIIETDCGPISELCNILRSLIQVEECRCKVIWLSNINTFSTDIEIIKVNKVPCDLILDKPFHGSRLYSTLGLVHDFGRRSKACQTAEMFKNMEDSKPKDNASTSNIDKAVNNFKPLNGLKILVVDDNAVLLHLMTTTLIRMGAFVESSKNGEVAVSLICAYLSGLESQSKRKNINGETLEFPKKLYDIILMDCEMPIMNGYEATRKIREEEKRYGVAHIPIIALTAHSTVEEASKSLQSGMDLHLVKPVNGDQIVAAIQRVLCIDNL